jgi:BlaI family penicillinase repressor
MSNPLPPLSPAETEIFRLVCEHRKAAVQDICNALPPERNITYATVQTLLRRLEKKGYLTHSVRGRAHIFEPAVRRQDVIGTAVKSFLDRLFGGDVVPLIQYLAEHDHITHEDLEKLRHILGEDKSE